MRWLVFFVVCSFIAIAGCLSHIECGCATLAPSVTFTVKDAVTQGLIPDPTFSVNATSLNGQCIGVIPDDAGDAGTPSCEQWRLTLPVGHSTVVVSAAGYQPQTFAFDATESSGCCSTGTQLTQTANLTQ
jgi:hypothetical protein